MTAYEQFDHSTVSFKISRLKLSGQKDTILSMCTEVLLIVQWVLLRASCSFM